MDFGKESIKLHEKIKGKLKIESKLPLKNKIDLSIAYTPGIAKVSEEIHKNKDRARELTIKNNLVAVISNGTAVLGLGKIGALASLPVMEGKSVIMKELADVNSIPLVIEEENPYKLIEIIKKVHLQFAAINLEDIKAPDCFIIERELQKLDIPVFHDDQHGTAIVTVAALINSLVLSGRLKTCKDLKCLRDEVKEIKIVINGAGAAANAIFWLLRSLGFENIIVLDSKGALSLERLKINNKNNKLYLDEFKREIAEVINVKKTLDLKEALKDADVFIGVSKGNLLKAEDLLVMKDKAILIPLANPIPEIIPEEAIKIMYDENRKKYLKKIKEINEEKYEKLKNIKKIKEKIYIYATGRSDLPNQVNNALAFPGLFKGLIEAKARKIDKKVFKEVVMALTTYKKGKVEDLLPEVLDKNLHKFVAERVKKYYERFGVKNKF